MTTREDRARAVLRGEAGALTALAASLIRPERDNLVARPWGGQSLPRFKRLDAASTRDAGPYGEAFEISACDTDAEARQFPSRLQFADGSELALPELLAVHGKALLGERFVRRHGACFPLLPKTLAVRELLSVQGHPPGNTEVYIIIEAEPGATLRLGFRRDVDAAAFGALLRRGLEQQSALAALFGSTFDASALQAAVRPWFAARNSDAKAMAEWIADRGIARDATARALEILGDLKTLYWHVLDALNEIPVRPGDVIYNATPHRLAGDQPPSAEVHALGNPEGREILALEIRRPGPTFRAWDNVRFPRRDVDVDAALASLNLCATRPEEFICERRPMPGRGGVDVSVDSALFRVEHLAPSGSRPVALKAAGPHTLHCLAGGVTIQSDGRMVGTLEQGESALVPIGVGGYRVFTDTTAELVRVTLPEA